MCRFRGEPVHIFIIAMYIVFILLYQGGVMTRLHFPMMHYRCCELIPSTLEVEPSWNSDVTVVFDNAKLTGTEPVAVKDEDFWHATDDGAS